MGRKQYGQKTTWFIDGNNLLGHRGTPKDPNVIAEKIQAMETFSVSNDVNSTHHIDSIQLVFDDGKDQAPNTVSKERSAQGIFERVSLGGTMSADDYILQEIQKLQDEDLPARLRKVQVVTADRDLRAKVLRTNKPIVRNVVNPVTFWRRYLPRLSGLKKKPLQEEEDEGAL